MEFGVVANKTTSGHSTVSLEGIKWESEQQNMEDDPEPNDFSIKEDLDGSDAACWCQIVVCEGNMFYWRGQ